VHAVAVLKRLRRYHGSEFAAEFWLISDAIRSRRSDANLVTEGSAQQAASEGVRFVQATCPAIAALLPKLLWVVKNRTLEDPLSGSWRHFGLTCKV
jgi:hypothetical protein